MSQTYTPVERTATGKKLAGPVGWLDERLGLAGPAKKNLRKVFPEHWSFMLGEVALWSFVVLLITGVFLTLWFDPSMAETTYTGSYRPLNGVEMSVAYASSLDISFDIRGGLLLRQMHHWAAHLFIAAMFVHMLRVFFTGAYRKPRELNWLIGLGLLMLGILGGFSGYSLPDDLLSGTGLRIADGMIKSIPLIGTHVSFFLFGGEFPGDQIIGRLYMVHILLIPALLLGLIAAHMLLLVYHKHTQFPGPGRTNENVVGYPALPVYIAKAGGFFFIVFGVIASMAALFTVNAVWIYGPYNPAEVTAGSQPDWYMGFAEGALRIFPPLEWSWFGSTWAMSVFIPGLGFLGLLFVALGVWPFIERAITRDEREHHLLERPRNNPTRTGLGVAGMTWFGLLWIGGGNDVIALKFGLDLNAITWFLRVGIFVGPVIAFIVTRRICISLQRKDNEVLTHGYETGVIDRSPDGGYSERHAALPIEKQYAVTSAKERPKAIEAPELVDENGVDAPRSRRERLRHRMRRFYYFGSGAVDKPTAEDMAHAEEHLRGSNEHPIELGEDFQGVSETGVPRVH
ncbi:cytochrome bc complex cytochrome b subunit [Aeromicrobium camelliae]|uniref:Cytochrome bc1 complex cytochrome b subunit n=1 Tax=Aeromicrobium camelliae TaxID=1538144 RepID=A0A3N6WMX2_9ACTN|nr:cytochrome bc complex cytochrome b subunit [Aeromicrobium camelliae]RQN03145.1 cytochrome bc complex cytochrome b subunit [Aeromicrobium camelliae]